MRSKSVQIVFAVLALLAFACAKDESLDVLKSRAMKENQPRLYAEVVRRQIEVANGYYSAGDIDKAQAVIADIVDLTGKCIEAAQKNHSKLKDTELTLYRAGRRLEIHPAELRDDLPLRGAEAGPESLAQHHPRRALHGHHPDHDVGLDVLHRLRCHRDPHGGEEVEGAGLGLVVGVGEGDDVEPSRPSSTAPELAGHLGEHDDRVPDDEHGQQPSHPWIISPAFARAKRELRRASPLLAQNATYGGRARYWIVMLPLNPLFVSSRWS